MQDFTKKIIEIIKANFTNGIHDDFIDTTKVSKIYSINYPNENISQDLIVRVIHNNGIETRGRFYFVEDREVESIRRLLDDLLQQYFLVFYSVLLEKHLNLFSSLHILSHYVLKKILQETCSDFFYFSEFCSANKLMRLDYAISQIFMPSEKSLSLKDLQDKLPYVPPEKILEVLKDSKRYLTTNTGKFLPVANIKFDLDEINSINQQLSSNVDANGYDLGDCELFSTFALNPDLREKDLLNLIYEKFFSRDFIKRGKRLFRKGVPFKEKRSTTQMMRLRNFISVQDELSVEKLFAFADDLGINQHAALCVSLDSMVRVTKNLFVRDSLICFDVAAIDDSLDSFVQNKIIPLRAVSSFTGFPSVENYSWNLFLLESFLRKFSQKYSFDTSAANSLNVGAVYPKSMNFLDYAQLQASVILQEKLPLEESAVENFLIKNGFRAKRIDKATKRIIALAQEIIRH